MRRSIAIPIAASMLAIAAAALVSVGLSHPQTMIENVGSMRSSMHGMGKNDQTECDGDMSTHMNATQHMPEDMHDGCDDVHDRMENMTSHMRDMH